MNDGFNETGRVSGRFVALGAPPQVSIAHTLAVIPGDATLSLSGEAYDQALRKLGGRRLRWFDGTSALGTGTSIDTGPLPPGANRIRLIARDAAGRTAAAAITVTVAPVSLPFLKLSVPKRLSRRARALTLTASSSLPASLTIGRATAALGPRASRLRLHVAPGSSQLLLRATVTAAGTRTPFALAVSRG